MTDKPINDGTTEDAATPTEATVNAENKEAQAPVVTPNVGTPNTGTPNTGTPNAGTPNAGTPNAGTPNAGTPNAGTPNAGTPNAGTPNAGTPNAGTPTAGTPTAGTPTAGTPTAGTPTASAAPASATEEPTAAEAPAAATTVSALTHEWSEPKSKAGGYHWGTGRRKAAIARVRIKKGSGQFKINGKEIKEYFRLDRDQQMVVAPLEATDTRKRVDVFVNAHGGGTSGQVGAVLLGIARALLKASSEYQALLREGDYLTRDARKVERKKYGQRGARRGFQFSKR